VSGRYADGHSARARCLQQRVPFSRLFSSLTCGMSRAQPARRGVAAVLLCQLLLVSACATQTSRQQAGTDAIGGIAVVPLVDGATRVDIATDSAFDYGSAVLRPAFAERLGQVINPYKQRQVRVSGYTDNVGAAGFNLDLSQRRARAVADMLLEQGFTAAQITVSGYGEGNPVASNATEAGRRLNRRIEILVTVSQSADDR
jgi:outer membrane protein OmpA-like peptidoglycan-associated protein